MSRSDCSMLRTHGNTALTWKHCAHIEILRSHETMTKLFDARVAADACTSSDFVNEFHSVYLATHSEIMRAHDRDD